MRRQRTLLRASPVKAPSWSSLRRVDYTDGTCIVFVVPPGIDTRRDVQTYGTPLYTLLAGRWRPWSPNVAPWNKRRKLLSSVPHAAPDPVRELTPAVFEVDASTWCTWSPLAREALRGVTHWTKHPGVMMTTMLDGATAERVRDIAAQHGIAGLHVVEATQ